MAEVKPNPFARDAEGLIASLHYPRNPNGSVNWRALIPPQHLYVNPDFEVELKTRFNVKSRWDMDVTKVEDKQLLVTLGGWQELLRLRGYHSLRYPILSTRDGSASATCEIEFIGNFETNGKPVIHSESAGANLNSVTGSFQLHLEAMATNRAFARCVRTFLNVPIYGKDEFDPEANAAYLDALKKGENPLAPPKPETPTKEDNSIDVLGFLKSKCQNRKKPITFEAIKARAVEIKEGWTGDPQTWESFDLIPVRDCYTLLSMIEKADEEKKSVKK